MQRPLPRNLLKEKETSNLLAELEKFEQEKYILDKIRRYRMHLLAELLYSTGMRISEASDLQLNDVDLERGTVTVKDKKGHKRRVCFLNEYAKGVLKLYINKMRPWTFHKLNRQNGSLFGTAGGRLGVILNQELSKVCNKLKYPAITSHSFRHMVGYHLLRAGCDIRYIQDFLGHENIKTTQVYTKVDKEDLRAVLDQYHPRQFRKAVV